jgi:hypothetical protein
MWKHLESFHINQQPTYGSKYPAAQGISLAMGHHSGVPVLELCERQADVPLLRIGVMVAVGVAAKPWFYFHYAASAAGSG